MLIASNNGMTHLVLIISPVSNSQCGFDMILFTSVTQGMSFRTEFQCSLLLKSTKGNLSEILPCFQPKYRKNELWSEK